MINLIDATPVTIGQLPPVGRLAFGCWRFVGMSVSEARMRIEAALGAGMNLIDTADVYGLDWGGSGFGACEELLGSVLKQAPALRARMVLASKGGIVPGVPYDSSANYLVEACEASLKRLNTDYLDLYQIHRPDVFTHPDELAEAFSRLEGDGKIRAAGVSNFTTWQVETLAAAMPLATHQLQFSALHLAPLHDGTLDQCLRRPLGVLAWSPLAGGRLATGEGLRAPLLKRMDALAQREGVDRSIIALAFVLAHPVRAVAVIGTMNLDRLTEAGSALTVRLERTDVYDIIEASQGVPLP
jgi:predicted oxidoreductase